MIFVKVQRSCLLKKLSGYSTPKKSWLSPSFHPRISRLVWFLVKSDFEGGYRLGHYMIDWVPLDPITTSVSFPQGFLLESFRITYTIRTEMVCHKEPTISSLRLAANPLCAFSLLVFLRLVWFYPGFFFQVGHPSQRGGGSGGFPGRSPRPFGFPPEAHMSSECLSPQFNFLQGTLS